MTIASTAVYLNTGPGSLFGFNADAPAQLHLASTFDLELADHACAQDLNEAALEVVFEQLNIDDPEHEWAQQYRLAGHRSLSVGDVVVIGETAWAVASRGWDRISTDDLTTAINR